MLTRKKDQHQSPEATSIVPRLIHAWLEGSLAFVTWQNLRLFLQVHWCVIGFANCRYLYADLYATAIWAGTESPENSGNFTASKIPFSCARDSPIQCKVLPGNDLPSLGYIYSFGEDNRKDTFILTSEGVYRVVSPRRCNYTCSKDNVTAAGASPSPATSPSSYAKRLSDPFNSLVLICSCMLLLLLGLF